MLPFEHPLAIPDPLLWQVLLFAPLLGACIGSFLNVVIYRLPREHLSIVSPGSHCTFCGTPLAWYDNIPIISYLWLGGKCRSCRVAISSQYLVLEALMAVVFFVVTWLFITCSLGFERFARTDAIANVWLNRPYDITDHAVALATYLTLISALVAASVIDLRHRLIPDAISLYGTGLMVLVVFACPAVLPPSLATLPIGEPGGGRSAALIGSLAGAACGSGAILFVAWFGRWLFAKEAMGMGDVKLMALLGAALGWRGVLFALFLACLGGAALGLLLIAGTWLIKRLRGDRRPVDHYLPFGPYLAAGALLMLIAEPLVDRWLTLLFDSITSLAVWLGANSPHTHY
jgi:leader peptidase (prepilin peptidase)/N-methyltransferase